MKELSCSLREKRSRAGFKTPKYGLVKLSAACASVFSSTEPSFSPKNSYYQNEYKGGTPAIDQVLR
jgi:hypothetical protein